MLLINIDALSNADVLCKGVVLLHVKLTPCACLASNLAGCCGVYKALHGGIAWTAAAGIKSQGFFLQLRKAGKCGVLTQLASFG